MAAAVVVCVQENYIELLDIFVRTNEFRCGRARMLVFAGIAYEALVLSVLPI